MSVLSLVAPPFVSPRSPSRRQAEDAFLAANPSFRETGLVDVLRETEYGRLDASGEAYLDYTGGSLYADSQLEDHMGLLREAVDTENYEEAARLRDLLRQKEATDEPG